MFEENNVTHEFGTDPRDKYDDNRDYDIVLNFEVENVENGNEFVKVSPLFKFLVLTSVFRISVFWRKLKLNTSWQQRMPTFGLNGAASQYFSSKEKYKENRTAKNYPNNQFLHV